MNTLLVLMVYGAYNVGSFVKVLFACFQKTSKVLDILLQTSYKVNASLKNLRKSGEMNEIYYTERYIKHGQECSMNYKFSSFLS